MEVGQQLTLEVVRIRDDGNPLFRLRHISPEGGFIDEMHELEGIPRNGLLFEILPTRYPDDGYHGRGEG